MARRRRSQTRSLSLPALQSVSVCESWVRGPTACSTHPPATSCVELAGLQPTDDLQKGAPLVS